MPFHITSTNNLLDQVSTPETLVERLPHYAERFDAIKQIRDASDELAVLASWGRGAGNAGPMKRVASVPIPILEAALHMEPDFLLDKTKFFKWLDKHPEFGTYNRRRRTS